MPSMFPDMGVYSNPHWGFARLNDSFKGSPGSALSGFLLMTSPRAPPVQIVITNSFLFIHAGSFFSSTV